MKPHIFIARITFEPSTREMEWQERAAKIKGAVEIARTVHLLTDVESLTAMIDAFVHNCTRDRDSYVAFSLGEVAVGEFDSQTRELLVKLGVCAYQIPVSSAAQ